MRRHYNSIDNITNCELLLSEASYNMACDWLQKWFDKWGWEVRSAKQTTYKGISVTEIVGGCKQRVRSFFYDEERGYLLGGN